MKIQNTMSKSLEEVVPLNGKSINMYTCGPTVYNFAHIGNFRAYVFEDLLRRHLKFSGFDVKQVMNLTDVDDKTIRSAIAEGKSLNDYTALYKQAFFDDIKALNIEAAEYYPAATDHVPEMIALIQKLFDNGYAYQSEDGSVYFHVEKFSSYGKLAHLDMSGLRAGARVGQDEYDKENVGDFALWKAWEEADGDVVWDSPWGRGRPGWHIECSAMSMKYLGESFDFHTGGVDNIFPHHENEIAQSEGATGVEFVKYWMHCGYLIVDGKKMSKSLGNFFTLRDIEEKGYTGREIRYVLISAHYRASLNFTFSGLDAARSALSRIDEFRSRLIDIAAVAENLPEWGLKARDGFVKAMDDDLNVPEALSAVFELVTDGNRAMDDNSISLGQAGAVLALLDDLDTVLGVLKASESECEAPDEVLELLSQRLEARDSKNWSESDRLRDAISSAGWEVRDSAQGQKLKKK